MRHRGEEAVEAALVRRPLAVSGVEDEVDALLRVALHPPAAALVADAIGGDRHHHLDAVVGMRRPD